MFKYAMKAAGRSRPQLKDRIVKFEALHLEPLIELHLLGVDDLLGGAAEIERNCREYSGCGYIVHFPVSDAKTKYLFDMYSNEEEKIKSAFDLCEKIGARELVIHRCFGFDMSLDKKQSEEEFFDTLAIWSGWAKDRGLNILVENYGLAWLPKGMGRDFVVSPLDHFFPWELAAFNAALKRSGLHNVSILLDTAHAVITSNMFNMLKELPELASDKRFGGIYGDDLAKTRVLRPEDFVFDFINYFHVSDSFVWKRPDGKENMQKFLYSEGLPLGKGNVDLDKFFKNMTGDKMLVMEIEPEDGDYNNNIAQFEAVKYFMERFGRRAEACV